MSQKKQVKQQCKNIIAEFEVDISESNCELGKSKDSEQVSYTNIKPTAIAGEAGHFASVQYHIDCKTTSIALESKVWQNTSFNTDKPLYVYVPKDKIALVRHVLEEKKINHIINDYSLSTEDTRTRIMCHFFTRGLTIAQREFLVKHVKYGAIVSTLVDVLEDRFGYTEVRLLNSDFYLYKKSFSMLRRKHHKIPKRILDLFFVLLLTPIAIPVGLITALLIKLETPGPVLFRQKRTGLYNKEYQVIKFRSMSADAEKLGAQWASKNDMRVTKVGRIIRKTRIDELPQLINVIKGEMSMVGPRPEREVFIRELEKEIPYYRFRHAVRPGVTGYAQVEYPYGASVDDAVWKHKYDMYYIKNQTLFFDLKILFKTVFTVIFGKGT